MMIIKEDGKKLNVKVGSPLTGIAVTGVTLTAEDVCDPKFIEWAQAVLFTRFITPRLD